jgi:hypothetical protein
MVEAVRTCPKCLMRVLPLADGRCPSCRAFNFDNAPSDEETVHSARVAAQTSTQLLLRRAAALHWRVVAGFAATLLLTILSIYVEHQPDAALQDHSLVVELLRLGAIVALGLAWYSASALARTIRMASHGARTPGNLLKVLKESMAFFEEHHVPMVPFGPRMPLVTNREQPEQ